MDNDLCLFRSWARALTVLAALPCACGDVPTPAGGNHGDGIVFRDSEAPEEDESAQIEDALVLAGNWEIAANQIGDNVIDPEDFVPDDIGAMSEDELAEAYEEAMNDPMWHSAEGERYEALFVTPDGVLYGRLGPAPSAPEPTEENSFGGFGEAADDGPIEAALSPGLTALDAPDEAPPTSPASPSNTFQSQEPDPLGSYVGTDYQNDARLRVSNPQILTSYPYRIVGPLSGNGGVSFGGCSGSKIGPRAVLTASHCVQKKTGPLTTSGWFNPGQTNAAALNGSLNWSGLFWRDWRLGRKYDYAVLFLPDSAATVNLLWFGVVWWDNAASYDGLQANNLGYPCGPSNSCGTIAIQRCAASPRVDKRCDGWMYTDSAFLGDESYMADDVLEFYNDVSQGHSGSAITTNGNNVMAVAAACGDNTPGNDCLGPRFRQSMWDDVCSWIAAVPSAFGEHSLCN